MTVLTKHHGLGNDFLVAVEPARALAPTDALQWCDRRRGIGADGLIAAEARSSDRTLWSMTLWNADGSRAEISGNGIRCLAQAIVRHEGIDQTHVLRVRTDGGMRTVEIEPDRRSRVHRATVAMGVATDGPPVFDKWELFGIQPLRQRSVDIGNPHLVVMLDAPELVDLAAIGPEIEADYEAGVNVHLIRVDDPSTITLFVWERGVGVTEACGSGASAAAWAAHQWGLTGDAVTVHQPGGSAEVRVTPEDIFLTGPTTYVATIDVPD